MATEIVHSKKGSLLPEHHSPRMNDILDFKFFLVIEWYVFWFRTCIHAVTSLEDDLVEGVIPTPKTVKQLRMTL